MLGELWLVLIIVAVLISPIKVFIPPIEKGKIGD